MFSRYPKAWDLDRSIQTNPAESSFTDVLLRIAGSSSELSAGMEDPASPSMLFGTQQFGIRTLYS